MGEEVELVTLVILVSFVVWVFSVIKVRNEVIYHLSDYVSLIRCVIKL